MQGPRFWAPEQQGRPSFGAPPSTGFQFLGRLGFGEELALQRDQLRTAVAALQHIAAGLRVADPELNGLRPRRLEEFHVSSRVRVSGQQRHLPADYYSHSVHSDDGLPDEVSFPGCMSRGYVG